MKSIAYAWLLPPAVTVVPEPEMSLKEGESLFRANLSIRIQAGIPFTVTKPHDLILSDSALVIKPSQSFHWGEHDALNSFEEQLLSDLMENNPKAFKPDTEYCRVLGDTLRAKFQTKKEERLKLRCVIRTELDGEPALFYWDEHNQLVCFTFKEGHTVASYEYYLNNTVPLIRSKDFMYQPDKIAAIQQKFQSHYSDIELLFKNRLK